jgi:DNA-binding NtrC family response regulator
MLLRMADDQEQLESSSLERGAFVEQVLSSDLSLTEARRRVVEFFDREYIARALRLHQGNVTRAAAASGLGRRYFYALRAKRDA